jgi:hypothetical protein
MILPIYLFRPLLPRSSMMLQGYAEALGMKNVVRDMHVTLAYSTASVDWKQPAFAPERTNLILHAEKNVEVV